MLANFLFQCVAILQSFCSILLGCHVVADRDGDWMDGVFNGEFTRRVPPPRECWLRVNVIEMWFSCMFYGTWTLAHCALFLCHRYGLTYKFAGTWDTVYEDNGMLGNTEISYDQHPYGVGSTGEGLACLASGSRPLI